MEEFFECQNLILGYGNQLVINGLSVSLKLTESYEITGKNGSGKSTLLNCISDNFLGNSFNSEIHRSKVTLKQISSTTTLIPRLTLMENVDYFLNFININSNEKLKVLENYQLLNFQHEYIINFSNGMIKRSELAIVDLMDPQILCIDEPYIYLDSQGIELLKKLINERILRNKSNVLSSQINTDLITSRYNNIDLNV